MITLTTNELNCSKWYNRNLVIGRITFFPLGLPDPSFLPLIGLGEVRILLIACHLAVSILLLSQRGVGIRDLKA